MRIPVIASLNGATPGGWIDYARLMEQAGADAVELNLYRIATDPDTASTDIERQAVETVRQVKKAVTIPVAVKLSPFYSAFAHVARELDRAGADGLVLFNRFYQPDIDAEELIATRTLLLSDSTELRLRLPWMAILSGRVRRRWRSRAASTRRSTSSRPRWPVRTRRRRSRRCCSTGPGTSGGC